jgi:hypothetical protein
VSHQNLADLLALMTPLLLQNLQQFVSDMRGTQTQQATQNAQHVGLAQQEASAASEQPTESGDSVEGFEQELLEDGNIRRRYRRGAVRLINPRSGIIQEEREDGSLLVSLPDGRVLFQQFHGEPLVVYDLNRFDRPSCMASVARVQLRDNEPSLVYTFQDATGTHLVEFDTLRYFRAPARAPAPALAA